MSDDPPAPPATPPELPEPIEFEASGIRVQSTDPRHHVAGFVKVTLEAGGVHVYKVFSPEVARRYAQAVLDAAARAEGAVAITAPGGNGPPS